MTDKPSTRSVKIPEDERTGWSSERPRRDGSAPLPDIRVRCRVMAPSDELRYSPGSLLVIVSISSDDRNRFAERLIDSRALLSLDKVRELLAGRVPDEEIADRAKQVLDTAVQKRLQANQTTAIVADSLDAAERERYVRMAAEARRPRHLILLEAATEGADESELATLNDLRRRLDAGELGLEGFQTAVRIGGESVFELKRIVFRPPPRDE